MRRKQIAAANWKMNLTLSEAIELVNSLLNESYDFADNQEVLIGAPFPYLSTVQSKISVNKKFNICAQNVAATNNGAYTGEVSAMMLKDLNINYVIIGHSERRSYFHETNALLAEKINRALENHLCPVFCCGEPLDIRESGSQNDFVAAQLKESLFHLSADQFSKMVIAYEPIWAIGTGKTATSDQAQAIHAFIRTVIASQYGNDVADAIPILYGGSVKASNAYEIFAQPDVDGGLVGGASLVASEFTQIIKSLKRG